MIRRWRRPSRHHPWRATTAPGPGDRDARPCGVRRPDGPVGSWNALTAANAGRRTAQASALIDEERDHPARAVPHADHLPSAPVGPDRIGEDLDRRPLPQRSHDRGRYRLRHARPPPTSTDTPSPGSGTDNRDGLVAGATQPPPTFEEPTNWYQGAPLRRCKLVREPAQRPRYACAAAWQLRRSRRGGIACRSAAAGRHRNIVERGMQDGTSGCDGGECAPPGCRARSGAGRCRWRLAGRPGDELESAGHGDPPGAPAQ